jgi:hypothetical protein
LIFFYLKKKKLVYHSPEELLLDYKNEQKKCPLIGAYELPDVISKSDLINTLSKNVFSSTQGSGKIFGNNVGDSIIKFKLCLY